LILHFLYYYSYSCNSGCVYIQYVDSTGYFTPREEQKYLTKAVVVGYLNFCGQEGFKRCHIFANANPSYLFPSSEENTLKKYLDDGKVFFFYFFIYFNFFIYL